MTSYQIAIGATKNGHSAVVMGGRLDDKYLQWCAANSMPHNLNLEEEDCKFHREEVSRNGYSRLL